MITRTPLDPATLSAGAQRALGAGPARMMAARGMVPLPPADQAAVLYQLALDADAALAASARATAANLPDKLLAGMLGDPKLDPRILDLFAELAGARAAVFDVLALNPALDDATVAVLAEKGGAREVDLLATNEQRLLRYPEIIAAMYMNRHARMSTIDRVVELAVRNHVRVPGLAAWDEVARALTGGAPAAAAAETDAIFAIAADALDADDGHLKSGDPDAVIEDGEPTPDAIAAAQVAERDVPIDKMTIPGKIRLATLGNAFARATLIRDPVKLVAAAAIKSPGVTDIEAARYAGNAGLCEEVIRFIATRRDWTRLYGIKVSLCRNPKTPVAEATRLLPFLRQRELENIIRSKGVSSAVVAQARKLVAQRRGGTTK